jgi:hypothetical protein
MTSAELENLVRLGQLKREPPVASEIRGLLRSGEARLTDAANRGLSLESRFALAYNAAHALALAALRQAGGGPPLAFLAERIAVPTPFALSAHLPTGAQRRGGDEGTGQEPLVVIIMVTFMVPLRC